MGYRISYENGAVKTRLSAHKPIQKSKLLKWGAFLALVLVLIALHQSNRFRRFFIPGNKEVTEAAVVELVESIQRGDQLDEAITTFCRQIIENEK